MKANYFENTSIAIAAIAFGIMAGFFWTYTFIVNRAMLQVDGATYAAIQSLFNQNVRHWVFFGFFFGAGAFSLMALAGNWQHWQSIPFALLVVASLVYIFGVILFTNQVNLPLNYYTESWNPQNLPADWETVRSQWNNANSIRVVTSGLSFILSLAALVIRASVAQNSCSKC